MKAWKSEKADSTNGSMLSSYSLLLLGYMNWMLQKVPYGRNFVYYIELKQIAYMEIETCSKEGKSHGYRSNEWKLFVRNDVEGEDIFRRISPSRSLCSPMSSDTIWYSNVALIKLASIGATPLGAEMDWNSNKKRKRKRNGECII